MTPLAVKRNYIKLWKHVENGTLDDNYNELKQDYINSIDKNEAFNKFCSNLVFDDNYQIKLSFLYEEFNSGSPGELGKKQFTRMLLDTYPQLIKTRSQSARYIQGIRLK